MQEAFFEWEEAIPAESTGHVNTGCDKCSLQQKCKHPKISFAGKGKKKILLLFENPTKKEDIHNKPFCDTAADDLRDYLEDLGIDMDRDCWYGYAVSCRVPRDKLNYPLISDRDIEHCQEFLYSQINRFDPRVIIPFGDIAIKALLKFRVSGRIAGIKYQQYIGHSIPDQEWKMNINPVYSMESIYNSENFRGQLDKVTILRFKQHLKKAIEVSRFPFFQHKYDQEYMIYFDKKEIIKLLEKVLREWKIMHFDYETTGIKPHREGHKIYTIGISDGLFGHAFPYLHDSPRFIRLWKDILEAPGIKKVAHHAKFEYTWSYFRAGAEVQNFYWCTMIAEHIQHNKSVVGAKFLYYVYLGVMNMDSEVDKYLKATEEEENKYGTNAINQIDIIWERNPKAVLKYNALDAHFLAKIYEIQEANFRRRKKMREAFDYYLEGSIELAKVEKNGICFDADECRNTLDYLGTKIDKIWDRTLKLPDAAAWSKNLTGKTFQKHLYDTLKYPVPEVDGEYAKGNRPESEAALEKIGTEFTQKVILLRKQTKIYSTIEGYLKECVDGIIRPIYGTHNVDTFRTSAANPNIQNAFKRNKQAKKMLRLMIHPSPGRKIIEKDYKAIEVSIAGCLFPDDAWLHYCINWQTSDMHRDCSAEILQLSIKEFLELEMAKSIRQEGKNKWVFPNIYGSGWKKMAYNLWNAFMLIPEAKSILLMKFKYFETFQNWIKDYYDFYWNEKYPDYKAIRDRAHERYERVGYVDSPVGYRYYGPMSYNDFCNYPVQGSAAAIKVWTIKETNKELRKQKMDSRVIYEIHDAIGGDVVPDEEKEYNRILEDIGTNKVREHWDWIITPLVMETESTRVNGNWADMKERDDEEEFSDENE